MKGDRTLTRRRDQGQNACCDGDHQLFYEGGVYTNVDKWNGTTTVFFNETHNESLQGRAGERMEEGKVRRPGRYWLCTGPRRETTQPTTSSG